MWCEYVLIRPWDKARATEQLVCKKCYQLSSEAARIHGARGDDGEGDGGSIGGSTVEGGILPLEPVEREAAAAAAREARLSNSHIYTAQLRSGLIDVNTCFFFFLFFLSFFSNNHTGYGYR